MQVAAGVGSYRCTRPARVLRNFLPHLERAHVQALRGTLSLKGAFSG